jgi:ABC-2 type transport system permease protein
MAASHWLRVYLQFARCAFQRRAAYRLANWTGIVVNFAFFVIHAEVIRGFYGAREEMVGWTVDDAVLYYATSQALLMVVRAFPDRTFPLYERIRSGDVALDLSRPISLLPRSLAQGYGDALYFLGTRALAIYLFALSTYGVAPDVDAAWLAAPLCLVLAIAVSGTIWYLANCLAFWTQHAQGSLAAVMFAHAFLGGLEVPLAFYPEWLQVVCNALPFRAAFYTPMALLSGQLEGSELAFGLAHQVVWLTLLVGVARAVEARGVRRLVVQGG